MLMIVLLLIIECNNVLDTIRHIQSKVSMLHRE